MLSSTLKHNTRPILIAEQIWDVSDNLSLSNNQTPAGSGDAVVNFIIHFAQL